MTFIENFIPNDPDIPDDVEQNVHLYVAAILAGSLLFLILVKRGMGSAAI